MVAKTTNAGEVAAAGDDFDRGSGLASPGDRSRSWWIGALVLFVYLGNGRSAIGTFDTVSNELIPYALIRGDGPFLDRFAKVILLSGTQLPDYATTSRGRMLTRYPLAPALIAVPLTWPQMVWLDGFRPGWDRTPGEAQAYCGAMAKNTSAVVAALAAVVLFQLLESLGLGRTALATTLAASLGTDLWVVASQAPWGHGSAALALALMLRLLLTPHPSHRRLAVAGLTAGLLASIRLLDLIFAAVAALWILRTRPRDFGWFILPAVPIAVALLAYNQYYFGRPSGGQAELEAMHPKIHGLSGAWTGSLVGGAAGTFLSPARGLFVFSPWTALAVLALPATYRRIAAFPLLIWTLGGLAFFTVVISRYSVWWGGAHLRS